jgi:hypothetical protein
MGPKSLIERRGRSVSARRLRVAANSASLRLLSSIHAQVQVEREAAVIPSHAEIPQNSSLDTSVTAAYDNKLSPCRRGWITAAWRLRSSACCKYRAVEFKS